MSGVPAPGRTVERVRARPDGLVRPALPVPEVVAALMAGPCPVADLVAAPAIGGKSMDRVVILGCRAVLILRRDREIAPATRAAGGRQVVAAHTGQALGVRVVESQRVQRQMIRPELEGALERVHPPDQRAVGNVVEEVEIHRCDAASAGRGDRVRDVGRLMAPAETAKLDRIEALGAVRDPVDPGPRQGGGVATLIGSGVGFDADLGIGRREPGL